MSDRATKDGWTDTVSTVLFALATVAIAWSGYQATRWSGVQAQAYGRANAARLESTRSSNLANTQVLVDVTSFAQWVNAYAHGQTALAQFYFRRFRPAFRPAVNAWIATDPLRDPKAPLTPFAMPQYRLASVDEASSLAVKATQASDDAKTANQRGDNYVLAIVLFATSLFFAGIGPKLRGRMNRIAILAIGCVVLVATAAWVATFPVSFGI